MFYKLFNPEHVKSIQIAGKIVIGVPEHYELNSTAIDTYYL